jgi:hypothetical protein
LLYSKVNLNKNIALLLLFFYPVALLQCIVTWVMSFDGFKTPTRAIQLNFLMEGDAKKAATVQNGIHFQFGVHIMTVTLQQ